MHTAHVIQRMREVIPADSTIPFISETRVLLQAVRGVAGLVAAALELAPRVIVDERDPG